ncbi:response regulator [Pseudomonas floridensis]|uniref:Response regulator n=1 Tax=Pseudomonas floridensis TaxID=1958950 RepID=A0A1X0N7M3_9PSED|nr:response regulator [Pseudomonas floridensis]ORC59762.1 response regulator [Pseudomonas floridensis]
MAQILIVEDNAANMRLAELLLTSAHHSVITASDAETGLKLASERQPDLILMDIQLPEMDGLKATSLLKNNPATAAIPVVALTAMAMKEDEEKIRLAGCNAYIIKPLRYKELYRVIDALLDPTHSDGTSHEHSS